MKQRNSRQEKGITLIALVITIIVMLILVAVTVSIAVNGGLFNYAKSASSGYDRSKVQEELQAGIYGVQIEYYQNGEEGSLRDFIFNDAEGKGQELLTTELGAINLSFDAENNQITYKGVVFDVSENGGVTVAETTTPENNNGGSENDNQGNGGGSQQATLPENAVQTLAQAGTIKRWDKISNYNPGTTTIASIDLPEGAKIEGTKLASVSDNLPSGASLSGTVTANQITDWIILDVNETTGEVLIMPDPSSENNTYAQLTLDGKDGYNNAIEALDTVAEVYANPTYATSARSLRIEDVNKVENYTPNGSVEEYSWTHKYGMDSNLNITGSYEATETTQTYNSTATTGCYYYDAPSFGFAGNCWLASRCVDLGSDECGFYVHCLYDGSVSDNSLFFVYSGGNTDAYSYACSVLPVVSLKSTVQLSQESTFYTATETELVSVTEEINGYYTHHTWAIQ